MAFDQRRCDEDGALDGVVSGVQAERRVVGAAEDGGRPAFSEGQGLCLAELLVVRLQPLDALGRTPSPSLSAREAHALTRLTTWLEDGADPVLRVNAAGILGKTGSPELADMFPSGLPPTGRYGSAT
jgi:hypothetical protein